LACHYFKSLNESLYVETQHRNNRKNIFYFFNAKSFRVLSILEVFFLKCIIWLFVSKLYLLWSLKDLQGKYLCSKGFFYYKWNGRLFVLFISLFSKVNICPFTLQMGISLFTLIYLFTLKLKILQSGLNNSKGWACFGLPCIFIVVEVMLICPFKNFHLIMNWFCNVNYET